MGVKISERIEKKLLNEHDVTRKEVIECFENMQFTAIKETREQHNTDPPTLWIISETNHRRRLKVLLWLRTAMQLSNQLTNQNRLRSQFTGKKHNLFYRNSPI